MSHLFGKNILAHAQSLSPLLAQPTESIANSSSVSSHHGYTAVGWGDGSLVGAGVFIEGADVDTDVGDDDGSLHLSHANGQLSYASGIVHLVLAFCLTHLQDFARPSKYPDVMRKLLWLSTHRQLSHVSGQLDATSTKLHLL